MSMRRLAAFLLPGLLGAGITAPVPRTASGATDADIDKVVALFSSDAVVDQPSNPKPLDAKTLRTFFSMIFRAYPDFQITVEDKVLDGWKAVTIERVTGHWRGAYTDPTTGKTAQPNGKAFDHPGAMYIVYDARHEIKRLRIFWDQLTVDRQLGITPH